MHTKSLLWVLLASQLAWPAHAREEEPAEPQALDAVLVLGRRANLIGEATSASEGVVGPGELAERPRLRSGDLIEYVPGMIATQHSGSGKANQYFLRGFNLDHGTDFATFVDGMPVNLRSHGHGQGYTDLNFLIPELVEELAYRKGTWHAEAGDFSSAGSAEFRLAEMLERQRLRVSAGEHGYLRAVASGGLGDSSRSLVYGFETQAHEGSWSDIDEDVRKRNLVLKGALDLAGGRAHLSLMSYHNRWNSPDQVPQRAIDSGLIDARGSLDRDLGGISSRSSLAAGWRGELAGGEFEAGVHAIDLDLRLWSNFTYFLDDPLTGDEFRQRDVRRITGLHAQDAWSGERWRWRVGLAGQRDDIAAVGLCRSAGRECLREIRRDRVDERSLSLWSDFEYRFGERLRGYLGWRHDRYDFEVDAIEAANSGRADASIGSPKASLVYAPHADLELYLSWGRGFHSNDARGSVLRVDPVSGDPADPVTPLARSRGSEIGARWYLSQRLHATLALWRLALDSELLYVGDAGSTEASRPSKRHGAELGLYWFASERASAELEIGYTDARFADADPVGREIPGAVPLAIAAGWNRRFDGGWDASLRVRHVARYPLVEDDSRRADGSSIVNLRVGRQLGDWRVDAELLNLLDSDDRDIEYLYASRLPGEPASGVEDRHFHAFEPRALRLTLSREF